MIIWMQAVRVFSLTASVIPVSLGAALAISYKEQIAWGLFPLVVISSVLFQAATNVVCDYYDFLKGVDKDYTHGSSRVLVDGLLSPRQLLACGLAMFAAGLAIGIVFVVFRGWPILVIGLIGFLGGLFYSARPIGYKYYALGDIAVFILMGPLMVIGSYFVLTGHFSRNVFFVSLPVACLVAGILYANNMRDIKHDTEAGVKTFASIIGLDLARFEYYALIAGAYIAVAIMVAQKVLSPWTLLVLLTVPLAAANMKCAYTSKTNEPETISTLDVQTAKLHLSFGFLLIASIVLGAYL